MRQQFIRVLGVLGPLIIGIGLGTVLSQLVHTWGFSIEVVTQWLASVAIAMFLVVGLAWLSFRYFIAKLGASAKNNIGYVAAELRIAPSKLRDPIYRDQHIWPLVPDLAKFGIAYLTFAGGLTVAIALLTNLLLMA